ncbi:MAG: recombination mediator RecR [Pseudomonadales bacterium]|nr:recombination mediator RecR [Pseudomonadales bacterium]
MQISPLIDQLIETLQILPGVGSKTAQRMAFGLLKHNRQGARNLAASLHDAMEKVGQCSQCRTFSEQNVCGLCSDERREKKLLCIVESPLDVLAIEKTAGFRGQYFVLHGRLSPIDGIGPEQLGIPLLVTRVRSLAVTEVILATNPTVEGEITAHYIFEALADSGVLITRIAHGVPIGGELEYIDGGTIAHAFSGRKSVGE